MVLLPSRYEVERQPFIYRSHNRFIDEKKDVLTRVEDKIQTYNLVLPSEKAKEQNL